LLYIPQFRFAPKIFGSSTFNNPPLTLTQPFIPPVKIPKMFLTFIPEHSVKSWIRMFVVAKVIREDDYSCGDVGDVR